MSEEINQIQPSINMPTIIHERATHKNIFDDLEEKAACDPKETLRIIEALTKVYNGEEPDDVLKEMNLKNPCGEIPEVLMKAYKWIWGQEGCNYPPPKIAVRFLDV